MRLVTPDVCVQQLQSEMRLIGSNHQIPDRVQQLPSEMSPVAPDVCLQQLQSQMRLVGSNHPIPDHVQQLPSEMRLVVPDVCSSNSRVR
jgi:hypothetical protein